MREKVFSWLAATSNITWGNDRACWNALVMVRMATVDRSRAGDQAICMLRGGRPDEWQTLAVHHSCPRASRSFSPGGWAGRRDHMICSTGRSHSDQPNSTHPSPFTVHRSRSRRQPQCTYRRQSDAGVSARSVHRSTGAVRLERARRRGRAAPVARSCSSRS